MSATRLVADVGGTNSRLALFDESSGDLRHIARYANADHDGLESIIAHWLDTLDEPPPTRACIGAAAPPARDRVTMINVGWSFSLRELAGRFGWRAVRWLNDFEANAHALPYLTEEDLALLQPGNPEEGQALATVGPGTGLGGATLHRVGNTRLARHSEPGHAGLSPANELELEIFRRLLPEAGNIYSELLVSGAGLARLYHLIAQINGQTPDALGAAEVAARAAAGSDAQCLLARQTFLALLGSACGDYVLCTGAYGGLYVAGGIIPGMIPALRESEFLARFSAKGAMQAHLARVPVQVITCPYPGLIGAAHLPLTPDAETSP